MNGLNLSQFKSEIVALSLEKIGLGSPAAINLLTGTALVESACTYLRQFGGGPALGLWQMEPATHDDCWVNFLCYPRQSALAKKIRAIAGADPGISHPSAQLMIGNLHYACAMARVKYLRDPSTLPNAEDAAGLAYYHKSIYNTALGKADALDNIPDFARAIMA